MFTNLVHLGTRIHLKIWYSVKSAWPIHTRPSGLQIPQWLAAFPQTDRNFSISVLMQSTAENAVCCV